ncbi:unnamed protein product [[Candida] boidinii]|nr:unnamed protein product [[Candida] boidinii]
MKNMREGEEDEEYEDDEEDEDYEEDKEGKFKSKQLILALKHKSLGHWAIQKSGPITWRGIQQWISIWFTPRALPLSALHSTHSTSTAYAANQTSSPETQPLLPCISGNFSSLSAKTRKEDTPEAGLAPALL